MNSTTDSSAASDESRSQGDHTAPVPNTSMLPGAQKTPEPAVELMGRVVRGAHETIDRLADSAAPTVRQIGQSLSSAEETLHAKTDQLRETRDAWTESLRSTVRGSPLAAIAAALVVGAVIARLRR